MGSPDKRIISRSIPAAAWTVVVVILSLMPANDLPESPFLNIPHFDKLVHAGMYFILAILLVNPLQRVKLPAYFYTAAFSVLLGGGLELLQSYCTANRTGSWFDLLANVLGIAGGLVIYLYFIDRRMTLTRNNLLS